MKHPVKYIAIHIVTILLCFSFNSLAKNVATFQKKGSKKVVSIPFQQMQMSYQILQQTTLNPPSREQFAKDFIRYRVAIEEAYNDPSLVSSEKVREGIRDPELRNNFDQILYKIFVAKKLRKPFAEVENDAKNLSVSQLQAHYKKNPYYSFSFIVISIPSSASNSQIKNIQARAKTIHKQVVGSQKPFDQLVTLYSDNKRIGKGDVIHSQSTVYPLIYTALQKLKPGQISSPIRTPNGFYILKFNRELPFDQANKEDLRQQILSARKSEAFDQYMNQLLKGYKVTTDSKAVRSL